MSGGDPKQEQRELRLCSCPGGECLLDGTLPVTLATTVDPACFILCVCSAVSVRLCSGFC